MLDKRTMRTWAEIDLDALAHNYRTLKAGLPEGCRFMGLVKANAYGHGAVPVARKLQELGADMLAVACLAEAEELRRAGITMPILCLGQTLPEYVPELLKWDVRAMVEDLETAKAMSAAAEGSAIPLRVHVKLDTGMGRLGFLWNEGDDHSAVLDEITALCALPGLEAEGLFTHFADADSNEDYTMGQLTRYLEARDALKARGISFGIYHCGASAAVLNYPCTHMEMVRPGIALYGYPPAPGMEELADLKPVMTLNSRIVSVRSLPKGSCISYGCTATLERDSRLAVLPVGYGDGYPRILSNQMEVEILGRRCPIVGRVCMDMCMVDVTDLPEVKAGDVASLYAPGLTEQAAKRCNTIVYELLCGVTPRVPRIYLGEHEVEN